MKVIAAVDRSDVSDRVIALVTALFENKQAQVLLVNVAPREPDALGRQLRRKVVTEPVPEELRDRRELLDRHARKLTAAGVGCKTLLIRGDPGRTLVSEATRWGAQMIVMGSHGRGALYRQLMGSVSESVLSSRKVPVLIVPAEASLP